MASGVRREEGIKGVGQDLRLVDGDEGSAVVDPRESGVREVFGESFGVSGSMSLSSRAQMMRTGPAKVRFWAAQASSCWGLGTLVRSRLTLGS